MTTSLRHRFLHPSTWLALALASCALPVFAQNAAPKAAAAAPAFAAPTPTGYGASLPPPVDRRAAQRTSEQALLGAPQEYGADGITQGNTDDAQRTALLNEQRMTVTDGQGAKAGAAKGQRKAPVAAANGQGKAAGQPARQNAADGLMPQGAAKAAYADPYDAGKHAVYRSPW
jgi:hypothetical protein